MFVLWGIFACKKHLRELKKKEHSRNKASGRPDVKEDYEQYKRLKMKELEHNAKIKQILMAEKLSGKSRKTGSTHAQSKFSF